MTITTRSSDSPRSRAWASIPRSRSLRKSVPPPRRFPHPNTSPRGWAHAPATEESAGKNYSHRCPKGNRQMRRVLNQAANAAVKAKGTIFAIVYRRLVPRLGHAQAIGAITHRLCRLIWKILHQGVRYEERGPAVSAEARKSRARKMIRELRSLGYRVELSHRSIGQSRMIRARFSTLVDPRSGVNGLLLTGSPRFRDVRLEARRSLCRRRQSAADAHNRADSCSYSCRSAVSGSMRAARRAGR